MNKKIELHSNISKELLLKNGFNEYLSTHKLYMYKTLYEPLIILKMEIDLNEREVIYDVIDRNTQSSYFPFWNNVNGNNNLVAMKVIENFNSYIDELQNKRILKRDNKYENKRNKAIYSRRNNCKGYI